MDVSIPFLPCGIFIMLERTLLPSTKSDKFLPAIEGQKYRIHLRDCFDGKAPTLATSVIARGPGYSLPSVTSSPCGSLVPVCPLRLPSRIRAGWGGHECSGSHPRRW